MSSFESFNSRPETEPINPDYTFPEDGDILGALLATQAGEQAAAFGGLERQFSRLRQMNASNESADISYHARPYKFGREEGYRQVLKHSLRDMRHGPLHRVIINDTIRNLHDEGRRLIITDCIVSIPLGRMTRNVEELCLARTDRRWPVTSETGVILKDYGLDNETGLRKVALTFGSEYRTMAPRPYDPGESDLKDFEDSVQQNAYAAELMAILAELNSVSHEPIGPPKIEKNQ